MGREKLETLATTIDQGAGMKTDSVSPIERIRHKNLSVLVDAHGLAVVARRAGKPDRQIKDIIAGRKSFGEKIARAIEAAYDFLQQTGNCCLVTTVLHQRLVQLLSLNRCPHFGK